MAMSAATVPSPSLPTVYLHPSPRETLVPLLTKLLPYSLPLLRRIQFHFHSANALVLSTTDPRKPPEVTKARIAKPSPDAPSWQTSIPSTVPFAAVYLDRSRAPETECWIFSTADLATAAETPRREIEARHAAAYRHMLAILSRVESHGVPRSSESEMLGSSAVARDLLMMGGVHENSLRLLKGLGTIDYSIAHDKFGFTQASEKRSQERGNPTESGVIRGHTIIWLKYLFAPVEASEEGLGPSDVAQTVPDGLEWSSLEQSDINLIISRSPIHRTASTIRGWPGAVVRETQTGSAHEGKLAAWAFLAADGTVSALHIEERWRRRGLAKMLVGKLKADIRKAKVKDVEEGGEKLGFEGIGKETWVHSDTGDFNKSAQGVLAGSGGQVGWRVYWAWADLRRVKEEAANEVQVGEK